MRSTDSELPGSSGRAGNPRGSWKRPGSLPRDGEAEAAEEEYEEEEEGEVRYEDEDGRVERRVIGRE